MDGRFDGAYTINPGYGSKGFSRKEVHDIVISVLALSLAMAIIYNRNVLVDSAAANFAIWMVASIMLVSVSFLLHEFGHKFAAQRYGAWAEYRMFPMGLVAAVLMSFLGFLFAAPGAVYINGRFTEKQNGIISAAGPAVNIVLALVFFIAYTAMPYGFTGRVFYLFGFFNSFLALFNLLPVPPLDGSKVIRWNMTVWLIMIAVSAVLAFALF